MKTMIREYQSVYAKTLARYGETVLIFTHPELETEVTGSWSHAQLTITGPARDVNAANKLLDELEPEAMEELHKWHREAPERQSQSNYERLKSSRQFIKGFGMAVGPRLTGGKPSPLRKTDPAQKAGWSAGRVARLTQKLLSA